MKRWLSMVAPVLLSGCISYSLEEIRHAEPKGDAFEKALFAYYKEFARSEEQQYDWIDAMYFADKALQAAYGKRVMPEDPTGWDIDPKVLPLLQTGYEKLKEVLEGGARESNPEIAARAQYYFDCWVEQQEEGWQEDDIRYCREGFEGTMITLLADKPEAKVEENGAAVFAEKPRPEVHNYIVFFKQKQAEISASGEEIIKEVVAMAKDGLHYEFVLKSHTDTVGGTEENLKLTDERARRVRAELVSGGISPDDIQTFAFGESDPPIKTADNVDEPANQRVEIFLSE